MVEVPLSIMGYLYPLTTLICILVSILLNSISLVTASVKLREKRERENLGAIIGDLDILDVSLGVDQDQGTYTLLQFKFGA